MLRIGLIYNKSSGQRFKHKKIVKLKTVLLKYGSLQEFEVKNPFELLTEKDNLTNNFDLIVIAGGDGTVNGMLNILQETMPPLLLFPFGSGNDISRSCHKNFKINKIDYALHQFQIDEVDLIEVSNGNKNYCVTVACVGTDSRVSKRAARFPRILASARYILASLIEIFLNEPNEILIKTNDFNYSGEVSVCSLANTSQYGGGIHISPNSMISDSQLELVLVKKLNRANLLGLFILLIFQLHTKSRKVDIIRVNKVEVSAPSEAIEVWADGQFMSHLPAEIRLADFKMKVLRV